MSLVFYATEATGTETFFDQILQFAAIRTDADLIEIDRFEIRCRLLPHIVPTPFALHAAGVNISQLTDPSLPSHYEMICAVRAKLLKWSPTLFIGWNSIEFDENLVRQALYKTLHNPYLTNRDGNSRSDVMRMVQLCSLVAPTAVEFPTDENGQFVFTLEHVALANGIEHDKKRGAMGNVQAMLSLCRHLVSKAPDVWSSFMRFSTKAAVVDYINDESVYCVNDFFFGNPHSFIVTTIGQNQQNKAEWYIYDLSVDPDSLVELSAVQLAARLARSPKPLRRLKSNVAPMLLAAEDAPETCRGLEHGLEEMERRAAKLRGNATLCDRLNSTFESLKETYPPSIHVEKQIYDGFVQNSDDRLMDAFHDAPWPKRNAIVEEFQDPRLRKIGRQLIHLERPDLLDKATCRQHDLANAKRILGQSEDVSWMTLPKALELLEQMLSTASRAELKLLREHDRYLRELQTQAIRTAK